MESNVIEFLRTLPENSGQKVQIQMGREDFMLFYFMWFHDDKTIALQPVGRMITTLLAEKHWGRMELI